MILLVGWMYIHTYTSPIGIHTLGICKWGSGSSIHDDDTQDLQTHPIDSKDPEKKKKKKTNNNNFQKSEEDGRRI